MQTFNLFTYKTEDLNEFFPEISYSALSTRMTKKELKEIQKEFHRQKEIYEKNHGILMSEERKKSLYRLK